MRTVKEVSSLTGVSIRALHYYDTIGLLHPAEVTESGYRLYDDKALEKLQMILLFRELKFPLKDIQKILQSTDFDRAKALEQQIALLSLQKEHIENLISLAREIQQTGVKNMLDFSAFDTKKMDDYARRAKEAWGSTEAYQEFEQKAKYRSAREELGLGEGLMDIFREFGQMRDTDVHDGIVQRQVEKLRDYITAHYYQCTPEILQSLGCMYAAGGEFTENIDRAGGTGTAVFVQKAIESFCR
ncbi:transcriptional regulator, MerR family [Marvinbryantia formatexigens DSM 14469]|uniref:Transcriptional regulator, MerR family n=1 Tax=Marvinbryantia formatexigens DSM 14469 TaxID=478749 RepID=C6LK68_9FIRM|nr:MerR family transcriptional regulator [Marvinbryantia formatexigens]EET58949.1 transcriptional regulator, MerR family [Marvinbryantia formatexigens DSM 14469]UWO23439.1 MerR family transcriptional regulator [Marvinbryantia formatexigens DSM 14469]SDH18871.1 DNA-binding transcriptional regulator, MerR family [Marvinbryantia formatexigens]